MKKVLRIELIKNEDGFGEDSKAVLCVRDLYKYPDETVENKDLFCAKRFLEILKLGMRLSKEGCSKVRLIGFSEEEE